MNILAKVKAIPHHLPHGTAGRSLTGVAVDKGERFGAAFLFGAAKGYYGEKFIWKGHGLDLWLGVGALAAATGLCVIGGSKSYRAAAHLERIGDAGVMSALNSLGASWGLEKQGRVVATISPGKNAGALGKRSVVGAIAPAAAGPFLSADEIARFANRR